MNDEDKKNASASDAAEVDTVKAELEALKADKAKVDNELSQAQHTIVTLKKAPKTETATAQINIEEIQEQALELAKVEIEKHKLEISSENFNDVLSQLVTDPAEREAVKGIYENRITKTGFTRSAILADLQDAMALANKPKADKTLEEMRAAAVSKGTQSTSTGTSQQVEVKTENLSDAEKVWVDKMVSGYGYKREDVVKQLMSNRKS